jgi:hypothetical protein
MDNSSETKHTVVTMTDLQPHSVYAPLAVVEAYWEALRAGREMPKRAEIDPRGIESALEFAFILERVAPGVARMRIAGTHLHDIMGMEARGMPLTSFFQQDCRTRVAGLLEEVFQTPAMADVVMNAPATSEAQALEARMVLLPLKSDLGDVSRILGCVVSMGELGSTPRRFDMTHTRLRPLITAPQKPPSAAALHHEFAQDQQPFVPKAAAATPKMADRASKRPAYLRLVKNKD